MLQNQTNDLRRLINSINTRLMGLILLVSFLAIEINELNSNSSPDPKDHSTEICNWLQTTASVVRLVDERAFRNVDFSEFFKNALRSAVAGIDAHSSFVTNYKEMMEGVSGSFSGVGVSVIGKAVEDDFLLIIDVVQDGPAEKAGLCAGDKIIAVDELKIKGMSTSEVIAKMKGLRGSRVNIKILRRKQILDFELTRDTITDQSSWCYHFPKQQIYYLSLKVFSENATQQLQKLLKKINADQLCRGLILDLRNNPGGIMETAVDIAGLFLPKNSLVVSTKDKFNHEVKLYRTMSEPILQRELPIIVLVNNFSASASEILAGALRWHSQEMYQNTKTNPSYKRKLKIMLAGNQTYGKGSVQSVIPVGNGCALTLTEMLYFLPDGKCIQAKGVTPDIHLPLKYPISREGRWILELCGQEKSVSHHITTQETELLQQGKTPALHTSIDKAEAKRMQRLESLHDKEDSSNDGEEDDFVFQDVGSPEVNEMLEAKTACANDENGDTKHKKLVNAQQTELKAERRLARDHQIQASINMINLLNLAESLQPQKVATRQQALDFLNENFVCNDKLEVKKLK